MRAPTPRPAPARAAAPPPPAPPPLPRRAALLESAAVALARLVPPARAEEAATAPSTAAAASLDAFLPDLPATPLPADFVASSRRLVKTLRAAVEADRSDAGEFEVRRKAEPAKNAVRDWMARWGGGGGPAVGGTRPHAALTRAIQTLGDFYRARGQRARLDRGTADVLIAALDEADEALGGSGLT